eukprot:CFRG4733T1
MVMKMEEFLVDERGQEKVTRNRCRWTLVWLFFTVGIIPLSGWIGFINETPAFIISQVVTWIGVLVLLVAAINVLRNLDRLWRTSSQPQDYTALNIGHVVVMNAYNEPIEVVCTTLDSIAKQTVAHNIIVVAGFEETTTDLAYKTRVLEKRFCSTFHSFHVVQHPSSWSGPREVKGKCSNANYAQRCVATLLTHADQQGFFDDQLTMTSVDADTLFPPRYFEELGHEFTVAEEPCFWQAPLAYNYCLTERPLYVRCIAQLRSAFMLGLFIPLSINPMSVYSLPYTLARDAGFVHPCYQMDDLTTFVMASAYSKCRLKIKMLPLLVLNGPTSGTSMWEEFAEFYLQAVRWTIGAAEVLHFIIIKCHALPLFAYIEFVIVFVLYYGFLLCSMCLSQALSYIPLIYHGVKGTENVYIFILLGIGIACGQILYLVVIYMDYMYVRLLEMNGMVTEKKERAGVCQRFFNWVFMWPSLLLYSIIEYIALWQVILMGKSVCGHRASKKEGLV